jgi:hypothetical protein
VRGSLSGAYLRLTGGTLTGALTINANTSRQLVIDRPDGAAAAYVQFRLAGVDVGSLVATGAEPRLGIFDAAVNPLLTIRTDTGLLGNALIPLSMLRVDDQAISNGGVVTLLAGYTEIATGSAANVAVGDRILISAVATALKGAAAGDTTIRIDHTGTATIVWDTVSAVLDVTDAIAIAATPSFTVSGIGVVVVAGTFIPRLGGLSAGSNSTVAVNAGRIRAITLRG